MNKKWRYNFPLIFITTLLVSTGSAWALTAANTQIVNNASLSYNDGTGIKTVNATPVVVTVSLIPGKPTVVKGPDQTTPYTSPNTPIVNTFTITATNTNGPDNYSLTPAITGTPSNTTGASIALTSPASPVKLGATVTLSGSTQYVINVPSDGASDAEVNGIAVGDTIVIGSEARSVNAINDAASGTATITVGNAGSGTGGFTSAPLAGVLVAEQKTVTATVQSGTISTAGSNIVITKQLTVASMTDSAMTSNDGPITDTYTSGLATLTKYVRNVSHSAMAGSGATASYNGATYYAAGITAQPGDFLEYILVAANNGSGTVSATSVADILPTAYVTLRAGAYSSGTREVTYVDETGLPANAIFLTQAVGDDRATYAAGTSTLTVNVGAGGTSAAGGTIAAGATVRVLYQVTVNP